LVCNQPRAWQTAGAMQSASQRSLRLPTLCVHSGTYLDEKTGGACSPIFTSTACAFPNPANENYYPRYFNTPNQRVIAQKIAALEGGEAALVFGSWMAAISTVLFDRLKPGDHAVFQADLYGGTFLLIEELKRFGVGISLAPSVDAFASSIRPETKLLFLESPSNPLLRVLDIAAIAGMGRERGLLTVIDNTFATPVNQKPLALGIDVVIHSATKYLNGHSDLNAGLVVANAATIHPLSQAAVNHGGILDAHACYLLERGMKTLVLRMNQHNANALRAAQFLEGHSAVARVYYPGLNSHPSHELAARQMRGFGGMLSFELTDATRVDRVLSRFQLIMPALSLGGVESLVCVPARTSHRKLTPAERQSAGISDGLIRVSIGIEDPEDLLEDFSHALS